MMRVIRDFKCLDGHVTERYIDAEVDSIPCKDCGNVATKTLGYGTLILDGTDPSLPGAYNRWATVREQRHRQTIAKKAA